MHSIKLFAFGNRLFQFTHTHIISKFAFNSLFLVSTISRLRRSIYWIFGKLAYTFENWKLFILKVKQCEFHLIWFIFKLIEHSKVNLMLAFYTQLFTSRCQDSYELNTFSLFHHIYCRYYMVALNSFNGSIKNLVEYSYVL